MRICIINTFQESYVAVFHRHDNVRSFLVCSFSRRPSLVPLSPPHPPPLPSQRSGVPWRWTDPGPRSPGRQHVSLQRRASAQAQIQPSVSCACGGLWITSPWRCSPRRPPTSSRGPSVSSYFVLLVSLVAFQSATKPKKIKFPVDRI